MQFSHFALVGAYIVLFTIEECENCGGQVAAPNTMKAPKSEKKKLERLGLSETPHVPAEQYWSDDLDMCVCENCM